MFKKQSQKSKKEIFYCDIGDYLKKNEKLNKIKNYKSINGIIKNNNFSMITPDEEYNWINQGDKVFQKFYAIGNKKDKQSKKIFTNYSRGIETGRDVWCYNFSKQDLLKSFTNQLNFYNLECERLRNESNLEKIKKLAEKNAKTISWTSGLFDSLRKGAKADVNDVTNYIAHYRPFCYQHLVTHNMFIHRYGQMQNIFPNPDAENLVICTAGTGGTRDFSCLMSSIVPDIQMIFNGQNFPLYLYDKNTQDGSLFNTGDINQKRRYGINKDALNNFRLFYKSNEITEKDIFFYIYGVLHSPEYKTRFANNLLRELARIPFIKSKVDFFNLSKLGRQLSNLHTDFEKVPLFQTSFKDGDLKFSQIDDPKSFFYVRKMKFKNKNDKSIVVYNHNITIKGIPVEAYEYVINGKPALEWVMERQCVKLDKVSGIVNDANIYANEVKKNPAYPLELFQRIITVSLETIKIIKELPSLDIKY